MNMSSLQTKVRRFPAVTALLCGAALALKLACPVSAALPHPGDTFPALDKFGLEGELPQVEGKVVLLDFWASWCAPCKKSFPVMKDLQDKFGSRGFLVVAVCLDEKKAAMDGFLKKNPVPFVVLHDSKGQLAQRANIEKMPSSFLIGADGKVVSVHSGFDGESTRKAYLAEIEASLKAAGR
jgi:cytochrome c biogenesis protein CcmG/thiol:disulfide interchange protein DsbE